MEKILFREYQTGDEKQIVPLLNSVFLKKGSEKEWFWKFKENPSSFSLIFVAENNKKIIGYCASIPFTFKFKDNFLTFFNVVDAAVSSSWRKKGVYKKLRRILLEKIKLLTREQIVYGALSKSFANSWIKEFNSYLIIGMKKLVFFKFFDFFYFRLKQKKEKNLKIKKINIFSEDINEFWNKLSKSYLIILKRDKNFLNWRYFQKPNNKYKVFQIEKDSEILGYFVLMIVKKIGIIVDFFTKQEKEIINFSISFIKDYFFKRGAKKIICYFSDPFFLKQFKKNMFFEIKWEKNVLLIGSLKKDFLKQEILQEKNFFFTYGDLEI